MPGEPLMIRCEGSGCPVHSVGRFMGMCQMCGKWVQAVTIAEEHLRRDVLAMIERGDFDAG